MSAPPSGSIAHGLRQGSGLTWHPYLAAALAIVLCSLNLLVPIERGFPTLRVAGLPFRWPFVIAAAAVGLLLVLDSRPVLRTLSTRYCLAHAGVIVMLGLAASRSTLPVTAVARVIAYLTAYVLNFVVLSWMFERGSRRFFVVVLCGVAALAAALGLAEGFLSYRPEIYGEWLRAYDFAEGDFEVGLGGAYRVNGTLGNAIVYAMAMVLCLPFVSEIRHRGVRYGLALMLLGATALTVSKVAILALLPLGLGFARRLGMAKALGAAGVLLLALTVYQALPVADADPASIPLVRRWIARLTDPRSVGVSIGLRMQMAGLVFQTASDTTLMLVGHGLLSESDVSREIYADLGTVDNTYLNLFYEAGVLGVSAYLLAFGWPLWRLRRLAATNLHYYGVWSLLLGSIAFVSYHYYTFNFVVAASLASLYADLGRRSAAPPPRAPEVSGRR